MRLRKKPGTVEKLLEHKGLVLDDPFINFGKWKEYWGNSNPIHVELGTGKGQFITTLARRCPNLNLIGVEKVEEVLLKAARKAKELQLPNLALLWVDVRELDKIFAPGEVDRLYINFCDPWPRRRHAKRRLTHTRFLQIYAKILKQDGEIHFKTDNEELFEFSLNEFSENGWKLKNICLDVAKRGPEDNITTEYEEKFQELGSPIYRCEAVKMSQGTVL
ncbi:tRNA (guanosine(46)-N7)-methyltransferase TrmB [Zhaonella formicivorans]|uniref:tRNA (guanosine(46)-N7)-methyltransferase TrmB n=1 Tax=Zhaonella formicivorans TaxID=2528593 RepID=UPI0010D612D1|nr:tRNA (guanosine(46)-N7)-methyltransferase TrmB [Zhaonella formicivorans]